MRTVRNSLSLAAVVAAGPAFAQEVADCGEGPPITALIEPWEETTASLAEGAVRLAVIEAAQGSVALVVLTLPPPEIPDAPAPDADAAAAGPIEAPPQADAVPRRCRLVTEGGIGFATLEMSGIETTEDAEAATFTATVPALRFVPESSELEEVTLRLTFGVADDTLTAVVE